MNGEGGIEREKCPDQRLEIMTEYHKLRGRVSLSMIFLWFLSTDSRVGAALYSLSDN
jgi:hypothetical protein